MRNLYGIQHGKYGPMLGKNRRLVANELVESETKPVEVQDFKKLTDYFRGIYRI
jgi:hypothetical protein